jgi:hypothetical protein
VCAICHSSVTYPDDPLVFCDGPTLTDGEVGCIAVHKNCYGLQKVPAGAWR